MDEKSGKYIDIKGDGRVVLYKREHLKNPKWQVRIKVPNATGYKVVSTNEWDFDEAKRFALNLYDDLRIQVMNGGQLKSKTFKQVCDEWKAYSQENGHTSRGGKWDTTIDRIDSYAVQYFGAKKIDAIREADFTDYWAWRRNNYRKRPPTNATLKRERTSIMPVFQFALSKGYVTKIPETNTPKVKGERRPTFSRQEWEKIASSMRPWVQAGMGLSTWRDRFMASAAFEILVKTGLRIGELRNLRWRDIGWVEESPSAGIKKYYVGHARGKTGSRQFVFEPRCELTLNMVYYQRVLELSDLDTDERIKPDTSEFIFCHPDGRPIVDYGRSFRSLLEFAKVPVEVDGKARTIYSLRHFYATRRLSEEGSPYLIASQMGTSVEMLEKHYGQVINGQVAAQITGKKPQPVTFRGGIEFPF